MIVRLTNADIEKKQELMNQQMEHLKRAEDARRYLNKCIEKSKAVMGDSVLGEHQPLSGPEYAHYGFDYAQQVNKF